MTTINTPDDLLRIVRQNDEFREAMRRELLTEELLELPARFAEYAKMNDKRMDSFESDMNALKISVDSLRGDALENKTPTHLCQMLSDTLDIRRVQVVWMPRGIVTPLHRMDDFAIRIEEAADKGIITDEEEGRLSRTDMVARSLRKSDGTSLWIAAEASGVINDEDINRARQSAQALTKVYGQDALPVVYGYRIADEQRILAQAHDDLKRVHIFLESPVP